MSELSTKKWAFKSPEQAKRVAEAILKAVEEQKLRNTGYNTVRYGFVNRFEGEAEVTVSGCATFRVRGVKADGDAQFILRDSAIIVEALN